MSDSATASTRRLRVIVNTDAANEADDQFAIVHALLTPTFDLRGIIPAHFGTRRTVHSLRESRDEVERLLELMDMQGQVALADGAPHALPGPTTPVDSAGARLIVEEAGKQDGGTLYVAFLGPLTDMATALLLDPSIAQRDVVVVWIGGDPYGDKVASYRPEFNLSNDIPAANVVFESGITVWQVPSSTYTQLGVGYAELRRRVRPCGKVGQYLCDQLIEFNTTNVPTPMEHRSLGDTPAVGVILNPAGAIWRVQARVRFTPDAGYEPSDVPGTIRVCEQIDSRYLLEDFFAKLAEFSENPRPS
jgi:purine nucleosidase